MQKPNEAHGRHAVVGARPKSSALPGGRSTGPKRDHVGVAPAAASKAASPVGGSVAAAVVATYRQRLIELYEVHNPPNVARVDHLLKKYRGQEEYLYSQVCAKYGKALDEPLPRSTASVSTGTSAATSSASRRPPARHVSTEAGNVAPLQNRAYRCDDAKEKQSDEPVKPRSAATPNGHASQTGPPDTKLLARIDFLLLGERTGFFERSAGCVSSGSGWSVGTSSQSGSESGSETGSGDDEGATLGGGSVVGKPVAQPLVGNRLAAAAAAVGRESAAGANQTAAKTSSPRKAAVAAAGSPGKRHADAAGAASTQDDDCDMSDDMLADALAAKLQHSVGRANSGVETTASKVATLPPLVRKCVPGKAAAAPEPLRRKASIVDENGAAVGAVDGKQAAKPKDSGAPPPVPGKRGKDDAVDVTFGSPMAARPKTKARTLVVKLDNYSDEDVPPLFEQWLASLKFLVGWNEGVKQDHEAVKEAFKEHLREEGIEHPVVVSKLCDTVAPLLLDVRRIDKAVVKNVKKQVLKGLKTVQVSILRIVAYELVRELEGKLVARKFKEEGRKVRKVQGKTYLAGDIATLAKVVQHFRFDRVFSGGLHQLITSIRNPGRSQQNGGSQSVAAEGDGAKKRKAAGSGEAAANADVPLKRKRSRVVN